MYLIMLKTITCSNNDGLVSEKKEIWFSLDLKKENLSNMGLIDLVLKYNHSSKESRIITTTINNR